MPDAEDSWDSRGAPSWLEVEAREASSRESRGGNNVVGDSVMPFPKVVCGRGMLAFSAEECARDQLRRHEMRCRALSLMARDSSSSSPSLQAKISIALLSPLLDVEHQIPIDVSIYRSQSAYG